MVKKLFIIIIWLFAIPQAFSQSWEGRVVDSKTRLPVPFASLRVKNTRIQAMANADGRIDLPKNIFLLQDSLMISCVGYLARTIPIRTLTDDPVIRLQPITYQLSPVSVTSKGNNDFPYQLFSNLCEKYRKYSSPEKSKGYFTFSSQYGLLPLEIVECYFSGNVSPCNGISLLKLKNGRIGAGLNSCYSLNVTDIITHFAPFSLSGNLNIPSSAGNFNYKRQKRLFDIQITGSSTENGIKKFILTFNARKDSTTLFSGLAWINRTENTIEKLEFNLKPKDFFYLEPLIKGDIIDSIDLSIDYYFDNTDLEHPRFSRVSLSFSLDYTSVHPPLTIRETSEGNLLLYDFNNPFPETFPAGLVEQQENDYQKIALLPYDSLFWGVHPVTPPSEKQTAFIDYFREHGTLLNFSKSLDSLSKIGYLRWRPDRDIAFTDLPKHVYEKPKLIVNGRPVIPTQYGEISYEPVCKILVNPVFIEDSLHLSTVTLFDKYDSHFYPVNPCHSVAFLNLTFDIFEMERREMVTRWYQSSHKMENSLTDFQLVYSQTMSQLNDTLKIFKSETDFGDDTKNMVKWYRLLSSKTGCKRTELIKKMLKEPMLNRRSSKEKSTVIVDNEKLEVE
jgi:hypothetical protein